MPLIGKLMADAPVRMDHPKPDPEWNKTHH